MHYQAVIPVLTRCWDIWEHNFQLMSWLGNLQEIRIFPKNDNMEILLGKCVRVQSFPYIILEHPVFQFSCFPSLFM